MNAVEENLIEALKNFYEHMFEWETNMMSLRDAERNEVISRDEYLQKFTEGYNQVFRQFCCSTAEDRGHGLSNRPEYDPSKLKILRSSIDGQEGEVVVKAELDYERVFKMVLENGQWKIKEKYMIGFKDGSQVSESL